MNGLGVALGRLTVGARHCAPVMKGILIESWELGAEADGDRSGETGGFRALWTLGLLLARYSAIQYFSVLFIVHHCSVHFIVHHCSVDFSVHSSQSPEPRRG